ncbi:hypothetical protein AA309_03245 [Microvirga vignae]|uniref:DUF2029 domain-containing protein n=1 Tax=Microvirga vignae TaxID=1225564 RepID=A0A0H1RHD7_9HYPH|nr:glycosyltransferase family 87 protein [Microvirga vignae]KLK94474.1 hypothetical protein AA309_03245 [Microvirga vignae]
MTASERWAANGLVLVLAFLAIRSEFPRIAYGDGLWDFGSFVASGRAAAEGLNPYGIYPLTLRVELPGFESWNPNLNPPISALLFQLFDVADPETAFEAWRWISIAFFAAAVLLLIWRFWNPQAPILAVWAFALAGFWDTLFLGQIYLPLVFAGVAAWLLLERSHAVAAGILIGVVVSLKPNFLVWPALLFLSGYRVSALVSVGTAAIVSAIPLVLYGPQIYQQWFALIASDSARAFFLTNASFSGLATRAGVPMLGMLAGLALLGALAIWAYWLRPGVMAASALGLVASLLASPLGWIHYTLFLLPVIWSYWHKPVMRIVALLLLVPVPLVIDQLTEPRWIQLTAGSVYGWAMVLCLIVLIANEWRGQRMNSQEKSALPRLRDVAAPS